MTNPFAARLKAKSKMIPKTGFNLVGVDDFEREPGEELYLIRNFPSREAAERAQKARKRTHPDEITHVYGPGDA